MSYLKQFTKEISMPKSQHQIELKKNRQNHKEWRVRDFRALSLYLKCVYQIHHLKAQEFVWEKTQKDYESEVVDDSRKQHVSDTTGLTDTYTNSERC